MAEIAENPGRGASVRVVLKNAACAGLLKRCLQLRKETEKEKFWPSDLLDQA